MRQPLLKNFWIDSTRLQIFVSKQNLKISELGLRNQIITTVTAVEEAYYNLIYQGESVKVQRKAMELAERLVAENRRRVEVGALARWTRSRRNRRRPPAGRTCSMPRPIAKPPNGC